MLWNRAVIQNFVSVFSYIKIPIDLLWRIKYNDFMWRNKWGDELSPRTGRPKVNNPKSYEVKARIDENIYQAIIRYAEKNNITKTEAFRRAIDLLLTQDKK